MYSFQKMFDAHSFLNATTARGMIPTMYNGLLYRTRLAAQWALFFDLLGIEYEYDPQCVRISDNMCGSFDFYVKTLRTYFDARPLFGKFVSHEGEFPMCFESGCDFASIIALGSPQDNAMRISCYDVNDGSAGCYESLVTIGIHPEKRVPYLFAYEDERVRSFYSGSDDLPMVTTERGKYSMRHFVNQKVYRARRFSTHIDFLWLCQHMSEVHSFQNDV